MASLRLKTLNVQCAHYSVSNLIWLRLKDTQRSQSYQSHHSCQYPVAPSLLPKSLSIKPVSCLPPPETDPRLRTMMEQTLAQGLGNFHSHSSFAINQLGIPGHHLTSPNLASQMKQVDLISDFSTFQTATHRKSTVYHHIHTCI